MNIENLTNKNIKDFTSDDTIYVRKTINGFPVTYLCKFVSCSRGNVTGEIIEVIDHGNQWAAQKIGDTVSAKQSRCMLYGKLKTGDGWAYPAYHWFKNGCAQ